MTDFIRNILATAAAANASAAAAVAPAAPTTAAATPVSQIQVPPPAPAAVTSASAVEKQRLIKVEPTETATATTATAMVPPTTDASKAQRAARRDVVNARRDKRKAQCATAPASPSSAGLTSGVDSCSDSEDEAADDKSKKMKTSATSSVAVAGGLAASELAVKKPSFSSTMPPTPGLLFTPEIDAAGEERLRQMEAQLETLDPDSKEAKKKRRLIRNRMSAQLHRERKKAYVGQLEDQLLEKDRELKLLQEKLAKLMAEGNDKPAAAVAAPAVAAAAPAPVVAAAPAAVAVAAPAVAAPAPATKGDEVVIKEEPQAWDAPAWALDAADSWDLHGLEDSEMAELETADLLRDFDDPFAGLGGAASAYADLCKPQPLHTTPEIHAAKKNLAMMAAVMFSVSFFGNSPAFYNVTPGSNFGSTFSAHPPPKDLSQMSIASRIVACLEKTSWKEFRSVSSWISARAAAAAADDHEDQEETPKPVASPSAASDVTDSAGSSCGSPAHSVLDDCADVAMAGDDETDLIDEFEYPVEDPFGGVAAASWLDGVEKELPTPTGDEDAETYFLSDVMLGEPVVPKQEPVAQEESKSLTSRLYESLTALWREKNQVLLTVRDDKQQVLQRSVADMSSIRDGLESGNFFTKVFGGDADAEAAGEDKSVTFLYPMSAFASEARPLARADGADPMFLEVSCQLNAAATAAPALM